MKDYKRLTIRGGDLGFYGNVYNKCSNKDRPDIRKQFKEGKKSYEIEEYEYKEYTSEELSDIYKRLGELEDKIERQEMVSLNSVAKLLNNWFDSPCVYGLNNEFVAEYMFEKYGDWCEDNCGKETVDSPICWEMFLKAKLQDLRGGK